MPHVKSSPHRLVVRTSRCGRDNPGSTPGEDIFFRKQNLQATGLLGACDAQRETAMWCCVIQAEVCVWLREPDNSHPIKLPPMFGNSLLAFRSFMMEVQTSFRSQLARIPTCIGPFAPQESKNETNDSEGI